MHPVRVLFGATVSVLLAVGCGPSGDQYEPDDTMDEASAIGVGESQSRTFHDTSDVDYAWFEAKAQTGYIIATELTSADMDSILTLFDEDGDTLASNDDYETEDYFGLESRIAWTAEVSGRVYVEVSSWSDAEPGAYYLTLTLNDLYDTFEPDGTPEQATPIGDGDTQAHSCHDTTDKDYIAFQTQENGLYDFTVSVMEGESTQPYVRIVDADGNQLAYREAGTAGAPTTSLLWFSTDAGTYYLVVGCTTPGPYTIAFTDVSDVITDITDALEDVDVVLPDLFEPDDSLETASTIKLGTPQERTLHLDVTGVDVDYIRFEAVGNATYTVAATIPDDATTDAILEVLDGSGTLLTVIDAGGTGAGDQGTFTPLEQGFYYLRVTAYNRATYGPYVLSVEGPAPE